MRCDEAGGKTNPCAGKFCGVGKTDDTLDPVLPGSEQFRLQHSRAIAAWDAFSAA
jgi:hypothetical protein